MRNNIVNNQSIGNQNNNFSSNNNNNEKNAEWTKKLEYADQLMK
jgi:hypothetical protein